MSRGSCLEVGCLRKTEKKTRKKERMKKRETKHQDKTFSFSFSCVCVAERGTKKNEMASEVSLEQVQAALGDKATVVDEAIVEYLCSILSDETSSRADLVEAITPLLSDAGPFPFLPSLFLSSLC